MTFKVKMMGCDDIIFQREHRKLHRSPDLWHMKSLIRFLKTDINIVVEGSISTVNEYAGKYFPNKKEFVV
jgi:hypothetical protein